MKGIKIMADATETKNALAEFLSTSMPTDVVVISGEAPAALPIAVESPLEASPVSMAIPAESSTNMPDEKMFQLLAHLKRIGMCAKDMHYRVKGKAFYGEHLLADLIWDAEHETDDLIEIYFMGERDKTPPRMAEVCKTAVAIDVTYEANDKYFESGVKDICYRTMKLIDSIKKECPDLAAGTHAVLDTASQKCLLALGLISQTLKG